MTKEIKAIRPDILIIICTGSNERFNQEKASEMDLKGFLMKPIVKSELSKTVRKAIDESKEDN